MKKPKFLIYTDHPMCSLNCADAVREVLINTGLYEAELYGPSSYPKLDFSNDVDCVVYPGGLGDADQFDERIKGTKEERRLKKYIANGGRYLGICMGGYFAGHHYFNILTNVKAEQFIKRKNSCTKRSKHDVVNIIWENRGLYPTYFHDGAAFIPDGKKLVIADAVAHYKNGDIAAMIQNYHKGKVGVIGPHPEAQRWWFYSQKRITDRWHDSIQHKLLLKFVKKLLE